MRSGGLVGLSVVGDSVRVGEPFLDRFPGQADACAGCFHTERKLDLCYGSMGWSDRDGFLESKSQQDCGCDVLELSRSVQT